MSFTVECEHLAVFEPAFQTVADVNRTNACRGAGIEQVARLQREELRDVGDDLINGVEHIRGTALLHGLAIDVEMEVQAQETRLFAGRLRIRQQFLLGYPLADGGRAVESLADGPGLTCLRSFLLQVTGCEVDAYRQGVVVTVGKALGDVLTQPTDAYHHLRLVVDASEVVRDEEGPSPPS